MRDATIIILLLIMWVVTLDSAYDRGVDDGWYMHEAEENLYSCPIAPEEDWI